MTDPDETYRPIIVVRGEVRRDNSILMVRRSAAASRPGEWELPGGKLDRGETLVAAVQRELSEECGLEVKVDAFITDWFNEESDILGVVFEVSATEADIVLSEEHDDYAWVSNQNIAGFKLSSVYKEYLQNRLENNFNVDLNTPTTAKDLVIFTDGGSRGNPGPSATGYVIYDDHNHELAQGGSYLGITTNNQAEYQALLEAAKLARNYEPKKVTFYLDSQLVVNQMNGAYKIKNKDLWPVHAAIKEALDGMDVTFKYVPREENTEADAMVNEVLDSRKNNGTIGE